MAFATKTIPGEVKRPTIRPRKNIPRKSGFLTKNNENLQITNKGKNIMHTFLFYFFRPDRPAHLGPILHFFHTFFYIFRTFTERFKPCKCSIKK